MKALESTARSHRFNLNLLKPREFGRWSFQVHLAETQRNQRERNLLFSCFKVERDNLSGGLSVSEKCVMIGAEVLAPTLWGRVQHLQ